MKILEPKPFIEPFECELCGSQLKPEIADLRIIYDREDGHRPYIACPICLEKKWFSFWSFSADVIELAKVASS